jgi:hypothetical protein
MNSQYNTRINISKEYNTAILVFPTALVKTPHRLLGEPLQRALQIACIIQTPKFIEFTSKLFLHRALQNRKAAPNFWRWSNRASQLFRLQLNISNPSKLDALRSEQTLRNQGIFAWFCFFGQGCSNIRFGEFEFSKRQKNRFEFACHCAIRFVRIYRARIRSWIIRGSVRIFVSNSLEFAVTSVCWCKSLVRTSLQIQADTYGQKK